MALKLCGLTQLTEKQKYITSRQFAEKKAKTNHYIKNKFAFKIGDNFRNT